MDARRCAAAKFSARSCRCGCVRRPGADEATALDSDHALRLGSLTVPAGPHTIGCCRRPARGRDRQQGAERISHTLSRIVGFWDGWNWSGEAGGTGRAVDVRDPRRAAGGGTLAMSWASTEVSLPFAIEQ